MAAKILAVDDEQDILRLIQIKLQRAGLEVITAQDGDEGFLKALTERPDLVLLDVMMPKADGYTVAARIKQEISPAPVVIMLTAKGQEDDIAQAFARGADDYIVKPFSPRELLSRVSIALVKAGKGTGQS
jgi:two-component system alkaline phosphatase synthesis response regulator PhoP